jgi:hypothetical protein
LRSICPDFVIFQGGLCRFWLGKSELLATAAFLQTPEKRGWKGKTRVKNKSWFFCDSFLKKYFHIAV